jgi:hypothetical protein
LPLASFHDVEPRWTPRGFADVRRAWEGPLPDVPGVTARVEAAAYLGKPVFFSVLPPWALTSRTVAPTTTPVRHVLLALSVVVTAVLLAIALMLARWHLRTGRSDRRGAFRTAAVLFFLVGAGLLLRSQVFSDFGVEYERLGLILAAALYNAATVWLFYIALEPYVRRFWPQLLIGWTRLIAGRLRDPLVGLEILVGVAAGTIGAFLIESRQLVPHLLHLRPAMTDLIGTLMLLGPRHVIAVALQTVRRALGVAIQIVAAVVVLKIIVKRAWVVLLLSTIVLLPIAMNNTFAGEELALELSISSLGIGLALAVLLRFGFLAEVVMFYTMLLIEAFPLTANLSRPYVGVSMGLMATVAALSVFGFVASRGDEPLFGRAILD